MAREYSSGNPECRKCCGDFGARSGVCCPVMRVSTIRVAVAALAAVLLAACGDDGGEAPPPPPPRETATAGSANASPGPPVRFEVENATIAEAVRSLAASTGTTVVIDPNAQAVADCARITVVTTGPRPPSELFDLMGEALSSANLTLDRRPGG